VKRLVGQDDVIEIGGVAIAAHNPNAADGIEKVGCDAEETSRR